jgi:hypothetical protein
MKMKLIYLVSLESHSTGKPRLVNNATLPRFYLTPTTHLSKLIVQNRLKVHAHVHSWIQRGWTRDENVPRTHVLVGECCTRIDMEEDLGSPDRQRGA